MCFVTIIVVVVLFVCGVVYFLLRRKEHFKDPIYLNREKMVRDWYPRSNGSIYGIGKDYYNSTSSLHSLSSGYEDNSNTFLGLKPYNKIYDTISFGKNPTPQYKSYNMFSGIPYLDKVL